MTLNDIDKAATKYLVPDSQARYRVFKGALMIKRVPRKDAETILRDWVLDEFRGYTRH